MPPAPALFDIDDNKSFDENLSDFLQSLAAEDRTLSVALERNLAELLRGEIEISDVWDTLKSALEDEGQ